MSHPERTQLDGLRFFGMINASISHEIKNVLAIISESAGLMEDLLLLAQKGGGLIWSGLRPCARRCGDKPSGPMESSRI